jgi:hypothetical protein
MAPDVGEFSQRHHQEHLKDAGEQEGEKRGWSGFLDSLRESEKDPVAHNRADAQRPHGPEAQLAGRGFERLGGR